MASLLNPLFWANRNGIPRLEADTVTVSETAVTYNFNSNLFRVVPFSGLVLFKLPSFTNTSNVPVIFNTGNNAVTITTFGGTNATSNNFASGGIILAYAENNTLQLLSVLSL